MAENPNPNPNPNPAPNPNPNPNPAPDPVAQLRAITDVTVEVADRTECEGAGELVKKLQQLCTTADALPKKDQGDSADPLSRLLQDLAEVARTFSNQAKTQAAAAESARDNATKATTTKKATAALAQAQACQDMARLQAFYVGQTQEALAAAPALLEEASTKNDAANLAAQAGVDASNAQVCVKRARDAVDAITAIVNTI